ncbi:hypothetical protein ACQKP8_26630 [Photobacterium alginatilyticum]|uniref:hypothetical protein n=1 Tax=Photobacterium alginatilyticum TaxID=1775171 RepID=UPI004067E8FB
MKVFEIICLRSIGPVQLEMTVGEVKEILGEPDFVNGKRQCFLTGIMVNFDNDGKVEFIEVAPSELYSIVFNGMDVHRTLASKVIEQVLSKDSYDHEDPEFGYGYVFKGLQLSFWRPVMPEDANDSEGQYFESVAVGCENYFE